MSESTALWPLQVAVDAALTADAGVAAALGRPYIEAAFDGIAPKGTDYPFVSYGTGTDRMVPLFSSRGNIAFLTLDLWCAEADGKWGVTQLYRAIAKVLDQAPLAIAGFTGAIVSTRLRLVTQDATRAWHGVAEVTAQARAI